MDESNGGCGTLKSDDTSPGVGEAEGEEANSWRELLRDSGLNREGFDWRRGINASIEREELRIEDIEEDELDDGEARDRWDKSGLEKPCPEPPEFPVREFSSHGVRGKRGNHRSWDSDWLSFIKSSASKLASDESDAEEIVESRTPVVDDCTGIDAEVFDGDDDKMSDDNAEEIPTGISSFGDDLNRDCAEVTDEDTMALINDDDDIAEDDDGAIELSSSALRTCEAAWDNNCEEE